MSAVVSDLTKEVAALRALKERPLPITCRVTDLPDAIKEFIRTTHGLTRFLARFGKEHPELQNKKSNGVFMTPTETVKTYYEFPFEHYPFQKRTVDELASLPRSGMYLDPGLGKTVTSITAALFKTLTQGAERILVIVPPVILTGWARFLAQIKDKEVGPLDVLIYRGSPKQRRGMTLDHDVILVGLQIFKRDYERFVSTLGNVPTVVIVDEAHCLKNVGTDNHQKIRDFAVDKDLILLTGTPINSPRDAYGMVKMIAPGIYRSLHQFENIHVAERDFFDNVTRWRNLDLLQENLAVNSVRLTKEECIADLPPITFQPVYYDLDPDHLRLYYKLAEEHLLPLKDGGKIDATSIQSLIHNLGQLVCNWGHFAQDPHKVSTGYQLVEEVLDELGERKLVLFSNYKLTNRTLIDHLRAYNPVAIYGEVSPAERDRAIDTFVGDPKCRVFIGNAQSAGVGIDQLQHASSNVMYLEPPVSATALTQSMARVHRIGQTLPVTARFAVAVGTLQERQFKSLLDKEDLVSSLVGGGVPSIREALGLK